MKKVAIIGAGYSGLSCAKKLIENDFEVDIYEKAEDIGGMAKCINLYNTKIEKHYRHIFKSDSYVINLLKDLSLEQNLEWKKTKMSYYSKEGLYEFGTPISLMKYKPLNLFNKLRFGLSYLKIKLIKDYKKIEGTTAEQWLIKNSGKKVYEKIWEPLLISKFGKAKNEISMAWLWGKINLRSSSGKINSEELGYYKGSFSKVTDELKKYLIQKNCKIYCNAQISKINKDNGKWQVINNQNIKEYNYIISTVPYETSMNLLNNYLSIEEKEKMQEVEYTAAKTLLLYTNKKFSNYYWMNIGDTDIPFGGIIEHTNMIDKSNYNNTNILYISNYIYKTSKMYQMTKEDLINTYMPSLQKINPSFNNENIIRAECFEEEFAQPIIKTNYSKIKLDEKLNEEGLYICTMAQIYPEDRGMNYAIKEGYNVADKIIKERF